MTPKPESTREAALREALVKAEAVIRDAMHATAIYGDDPPSSYHEAYAAIVAALSAPAVEAGEGKPVAQPTEDKGTTPRVDDKDIITLLGNNGEPFDVVDVEVARQLERELQAAEAKLAQVERENERLKEDLEQEKKEHMITVGQALATHAELSRVKEALRNSLISAAAFAVASARQGKYKGAAYVADFILADEALSAQKGAK